MPNANATLTIELIDGTRVVVPDSLEIITPYVLQEQHDWFEDEIKFVRRLLRPGQKVIDIGANYGVYALSMAKAVGPGGRVWAFEPASSTAALLAEGIAANGFTNVVLEQTALSNASGTAQLALHASSELNSLVRDSAPQASSETVALTTLDAGMKAHDWKDIDFLKIDAEGEETNILKGGERFLRELSPLIQYEVKAGNAVHMELVHEFASRGYASYRLVPGLNVLVPFEPSTTADGYLLNLFCCKVDRTQRLAAGGFLVESPCTVTEARTRLKQLAKKEGYGAYDWHVTIARMPYGKQLAETWKKTTTHPDGNELTEALSLYLMSRDMTLSAIERCGALAAGLDILRGMPEHRLGRLRLASLARMARDHGARSIAVEALNRLGNTIIKDQRLDSSEPFLVPCRRYESIAPGARLGDWIMSSIFEEFELTGYFSSFYSGLSARQRLEALRGMGFAGEEITRRLQLLKKRFNLPE